MPSAPPRLRSLWRDLEERLRLDAEGPEIHVDYYRKDCADALREIRRLRTLLQAHMARIGDPHG